MDRRAATASGAPAAPRGPQLVLLETTTPDGSSRNAVSPLSFHTLAVFHASSPGPGFAAPGPERTRTDAPAADRPRREGVRLALALVAQLPARQIQRRVAGVGDLDDLALEVERTHDGGRPRGLCLRWRRLAGGVRRSRVAGRDEHLSAEVHRRSRPVLAGSQSLALAVAQRGVQGRPVGEAPARHAATGGEVKVELVGLVDHLRRPPLTRVEQHLVVVHRLLLTLPADVRRLPVRDVAEAHSAVGVGQRPRDPQRLPMLPVALLEVAPAPAVLLRYPSGKLTPRRPSPPILRHTLPLGSVKK